MICNEVLELKKHLKITEAVEFARNLGIENPLENVLFLINEQLIECFFFAATDEEPDEISDTYYTDGDRVLIGFSDGIQKLISPKIQYFFDKSEPYKGYVFYISEKQTLKGTFSYYSAPEESQKRYINNATHIAKHGVLSTQKSDFKVVTSQLKKCLGSICSNKTNSKSLSAKQKNQALPVKNIVDTPQSAYVIIGALLGLLTSQASPRRNQSSIKVELEETGLKGLSKGSLDAAFAKANKAIEQAKTQK